MRVPDGIRTTTLRDLAGRSNQSPVAQWFVRASTFKGARPRNFVYHYCIMSSKRQIGRARVFHLQNYGHITTENDFPAV